MKTRGKVPMRQCTGCREMKNKKEMMLGAEDWRRGDPAGHDGTQKRPGRIFVL